MYYGSWRISESEFSHLVTRSGVDGAIGLRFSFHQFIAELKLDQILVPLPFEIYFRHLKEMYNWKIKAG